MPSPYEEERVWEGTNQQYEVSLQCAILFLARIYLLLFPYVHVTNLDQVCYLNCIDRMKELKMLLIILKKYYKSALKNLKPLTILWNPEYSDN